MTDREVLSGCARVRTKYTEKTMLVCEGSLCPRKLPDVNGPGLGEAGCYRMVSEPTLVVSRARGCADATGMLMDAWRVSAWASGMRRWHWTHGRGTVTVGTGRTDVAHGP